MAAPRPPSGDSELLPSRGLKGRTEGAECEEPDSLAPGVESAGWRQQFQGGVGYAQKSC